MNTNPSYHNSITKNQTNPANLLEKLKTPPSSTVFIALIFIIIIVIFRLIFNHGILFTSTDIHAMNSAGKTATNPTVVTDVFILLAFLFGIFFTISILVPEMKDISKFLSEMKGSLGIVLYTAILILFFNTVSSKIINQWAFIIVPFLIILTGALFGMALSSNQIKTLNINFERIKYMILFLCFMTILIIFYSVNPGDYISKSFGYTMFLSILIGMFGFVYLLLLMSVPNNITSATNTNNPNAVKFNTATIAGTVGMILFLTILIIGVMGYPGGLFSNDNVWVALTILILLLFVAVMFSIFFIINAYPTWVSSGVKQMDINKTDTFKKALLTIFGITISGLVIAWLVLFIQSYSGPYSLINMALNSILVIILMIFIYKSINPTMNGQNNTKTRHFTQLLMNILFYIPCLFSDLLSGLMKFFINDKTHETVISIILLGLGLIMVMALKFATSKLSTAKNSLYIEGGNQLINQPVFLNTQQNLGSYADLNGGDDPKYQYALSFWFFLEAVPSTGAVQSYQQIISYGNKPNVLYRAGDTSLLVTIDKNGLRGVNLLSTMDVSTNITIDASTNDVSMNSVDEYAEDIGNSRVVFKKNDVLLQKWNHMVINYVGGTLDIFLNGKLERTVVDIVPYMSLDSLTIGQDNGIHGGLCNVIYFKRALTLNNIKNLYNSVKDNTNPAT